MSTDGTPQSPERSPEHARGQAAWPAAALLDALSDAVAVVDATGTIVAVNRAWAMFTLDNGGDLVSTGVGVNYLQVCARSAEAGSRDAGQVARALVAVLSGGSAEEAQEYACPSPAAGRWYQLRITPIAGPQPGALITHVDVTRAKHAEQAIAEQAARDPLTCLVNRTAFDERVDDTLRSRRDLGPGIDVGLVLVDLDGFGRFTGTYGRAAGDSALQTVAYRLNRVIRPKQTAGRRADHEFAVLAPRITSTELAVLADEIREALDRQHLVHGQWTDLGATVATYLARLSDTAAYALNRADEVLYRAQRDRRQALARR